MVSTMERPSTVSSQTGAQADRLYPSLPNTSRLEVCVLNRSSANNRLENTQDKGCLVRMKEQIHILEMQKQDLLSINERWAKEYRVMVQYYKDKHDWLMNMLSLVKEGTDSKDELSNLKASLPQERCRDPRKEAHHVCQLNVLKDSTTAGSGDVLVKAQSEARQLQEQNRALARRGQHQNAEIARLNKALEEALVTTSSQGMSNETLQELWKQQADVYKEDFLTERKDREALQNKYLQLEKKYKRVRNELYAVKSQVTTSQPQYECTCIQPKTDPGEKTQSTFDDKL